MTRTPPSGHTDLWQSTLLNTTAKPFPGMFLQNCSFPNAAFVLTSVKRTPLFPFTAWRQSALSFLSSTDLGRLWTHRRFFDTNTLMARSLVLFISSNWGKWKTWVNVEVICWKRSWWDKRFMHYISSARMTSVEWEMKNELTLVLLTMSASGTPSAALVPGRITGVRWKDHAF